MGVFLVGFVLPLLLLTAALLNWSLISLVDVVAFLLILFHLPKTGFSGRRRFLILWAITIFSLFVILSQVTFLIVLATLGNKWSISDSWWAELFGLMRIQSWRSPSVIYFLVVQFFIVVVALVSIYGSRFSLVSSRDSCWRNYSTAIEHLGSHLRVVSCLLLPAIQLLVGISHPSWVSLPFFIGSCTGLVEWSLTSNFLGLFSWWRFLRLYAGVNILLLYLYRLPIGLPKIAQYVASIIGLYKISTKSDWLDICYALSLIIFYIMISYVRCDLEDMASLMSMQGSNLTEQLLPSRHSFFIRQSRSGVRHTNVLLRGAIFRTFCINFFTYGFPISLIALSFWSFYFASVCAFGLLVYVGYILFAFPSLFRLHQLNGLLLVFILLWAVSTYIFNLAFAFLSWKLGKDMEIWEMIGLWHYPIPGFFLLAQFGLGALVAVGNLVNNSVFQYLTDEAGQSSIDNCTVEVEDETKILIVATFAWGLRKSSRGIMLALIFLIAMKPGFIHALYIVFFFIYLLSHSISRKVRQSLILLCEIHFAILYILQLSLVSKALEENRSLSLEIFSQLGLIERDCFWELLEIAFLACICAVHNHGFEMLFSFSAIVQHAPSLPVGFSVLKAGLNKSVLLSVYSSRSARNSSERSSHVSERRIASFISAVGQKFLSMYRSCGTYIAYLTVLFAIYLMRPNYISFGYMFLLLVWLIGRQLFEKTKRPLWLPIKGYAIIVFVFIYSLSIFSSFEMWLSKKVDLYDHLGYNPEASLLQNVWETLAVLIVMQLYSYERRQSKYNIFGASDQLESGVLGLIKRFLVWHIQKILFIAVFYVSLSPVSAFGFIYLFALIICSTLPKASRVPSKLFLVYTGLLVAAEYLFQMWGKQAKMFPGQKHSDLSIILGFQVFKSGFWGLEAGLRAKILVISACSLQYNVFYWVEKMETAPSKAKWEEPCPLFVSERDIATNGYVPIEENKPSAEVSTHSSNGESIASNSYPNINSDQAEATHSDSFNFGGSVNTKKYSFGYICGSTKESHKWNKKRVMALKKERFETQITTFKVYMKFWTENMFNLFGLEINMIVLLLISFTLLNAVSVLYIGSLALCVLLRRRIIRKLWPMFVFMNASILVLEYFSIWKNVFPSHINPPSKTVCCHDCWSSSELYFHYCRSCWLGLIVDDSRMLISYYAVFMFSCFKLCADHLSSLSGSSSYHQMMSQRKNAFVWRDLSFETKSMWTFLDYLRLYCYCHLLDLVLALVLITGTLEYDLLHLGYLGFALVFFRMRLEILKKKNKIFKYLRIYNFVVIVLSLAYQSPFVGHFSAAKGKTIDYIYEVIGFHKYDYGFRITSRSALVEIIIFMLVSLQSYMFSSPEFDYVFRYLEAEQIGAIVREQEKKAAWKTAQLKHIRESDEEKRLRNSQVEKIKSEMLNLQTQNIFMNSTANGSITPCSEGLRKRRTSSSIKESRLADVEEAIRSKQEQNFSTDSITPFDLLEASARIDEERPSVVESREHIMDYLPSEISEINEVNVMSELYDSHETEKMKRKAKENALRQLLGDGVYQVQSIGNQAVTNLASLLNVSQEDLDSNEHSSSEDGVYDELESQKKRSMFLDRSSSLQSDNSRNMSNSAGPRLGRIFGHIWSLIQSNNDVMCYCCFVLVFLWSFSLLSMVYLAALFLYALCVNTGPSYTFWVMMLVYTEMNIFIQYVYQILIQHCGWTIESDLLVQWGFPTHNIKPSFVISLLPLFLVYLFTLIQSSITAKDGEFMSSTEYGFHERRSLYQKAVLVSSNFNERVVKLLRSIIDSIHMVMRSLSWYWKSLTQGTESPPYFVQLSLDVHLCPEEAIQPEKIESGINQLLRTVHDEKCNELNPNICPYSSRVHVQSIERSQENPEVALAVLEIVYAASLTRCTSAGWYKSLTPAGDVAQEILIARNSGFVEDLGFSYPILSVIGGGKREVDLYAYIFGADLSVFFLVAIFYQSVIKNNSEFLELEDQFPKEFVFVLMIIFFLIVLDRIIYLWSFAVGKVFFYLFNLILFTYSVTEYAWNMEASHRHAGGLALRAIYLMKAVSLALQAVQIRYGVPHQSTLYRQYLTSNVSRINHLGYRLYRALPFLYELRCVLDWSCTTTSLTMYDWLKLEDIYSSLFLVKCDAVLNRANHKVGEKQSKMTKFCSGICLFFILICVIWAPMLMYSSGNPTNTVNPIKDVTAQLDIKTVAGRLTLYQSTLCERIPYYNLDPDVNFDPQGFLSTYDKYDIQLICCEADASIMWLVPSVVQEKFIQSLSFDLDIMDITFSWVLNRDRPKGKEVVKYERSVGYLDLPEQSDVQHVLNGTTDRFRISNVYPKYFRVTGSGDIRPFEQEVSSVSADIILNRGNTEWWSFHVIQAINSSDTSVCQNDNHDFGSDVRTCFFLVVDSEFRLNFLSEGILGDTLSKFSIWGLYITFVLAVGRFIRLQCSDLRMRIPYENLPSCDRLIDICEDLYAARAEGELGVEEVLYWTIVNIYRSPHMLLEYTKPD